MTPGPAGERAHCFLLTQAAWDCWRGPEVPSSRVACKPEDRFPQDWDCVSSLLPASPSIYLVGLEKYVPSTVKDPPVQGELYPRTQALMNPHILRSNKHKLKNHRLPKELGFHCMCQAFMQFSQKKILSIVVMRTFIICRIIYNKLSLRCLQL